MSVLGMSDQLYTKIKGMRYLFLMVVLIGIQLQANGQAEDSRRGVDGLRFMFYNVENLFDPFDDTLRKDEDFTPDGSKHWSWRRMQHKCGNIARVMIAAGGWEALEMAGFCEVENPLVIRQLVNHPLLRPYGYKYVVTKSPDIRGINLAFLYRPEKVEMIHHDEILVEDPERPGWATRNILYVKVRTLHNDTLHIFLNHWPSRRGGAENSAPKRALAAKALRHVVDSIIQVSPKPYILISGDFNDGPEDASVREVLGAVNQEAADSHNLINLMWPLYLQGQGTHAHRDVTGTHYNLLDQIIVSGILLNPDSGIKAERARIGYFPFLLGETAAGVEVPDRTYAGPQYLGGFSDHLPVLVDLRLQ
jgi:hypothetical protein